VRCASRLGADLGAKLMEKLEGPQCIHSAKGFLQKRIAPNLGPNEPAQARLSSSQTSEPPCQIFATSATPPWEDLNLKNLYTFTPPSSTSLHQSDTLGAGNAGKRRHALLAPFAYGRLATPNLDLKLESPPHQRRLGSLISFNSPLNTAG
jgi:hypothetical protein